MVNSSSLDCYTKQILKLKMPTLVLLVEIIYVSPSRLKLEYKEQCKNFTDFVPKILSIFMIYASMYMCLPKCWVSKNFRAKCDVNSSHWPSYYSHICKNTYTHTHKELYLKIKTKLWSWKVPKVQRIFWQTQFGCCFYLHRYIRK